MHPKDGKENVAIYLLSHKTLNFFCTDARMKNMLETTYKLSLILKIYEMVAEFFKSDTRGSF